MKIADAGRRAERAFLREHKEVGYHRTTADAQSGI